MGVLFGLLILALTFSLILARYLHAPKQRRFPAWGWAGLLILASAEALLVARVHWVSIYFTPLAWTGYLLFIDAATRTLRGSQCGRALGERLKPAFWSVPLWLIFEAYNLRLRNWTYVGLPDSPLLQAIGYLWSFATIWPAILMTAEFLEALGLFHLPLVRPIRFGSTAKWSFVVLGIVCCTVPALVPVSLGSYLFGAVWVGFILLLDPLNYWAKGRSLLGDLEAGRAMTLKCLLVSGLVCGLFWEFWNYWAAAKWLYVFPIMQDVKIFEMPLPGYLGFPAFALECFVMYEFVGTMRRKTARLRRVRPLI